MQLQKLPSIWIDSGTTINYPMRAATLDRSKRFEFDSIYYKDDPCKPKKKVDEFMFPHQLLINFRKNIRDASKSKSREKLRRIRKNTEEDDMGDNMQLRASRITDKLYQKPKDKIAEERDFYGNRTSLHQKQLTDIIKLPAFGHAQTLKTNKSNEKLYITASHRLDLSRPINFNPGPGSYLLKSNLDNYKSKLSKSMHVDEQMLKRKSRENMLKSLDFGNNH